MNELEEGKLYIVKNPVIFQKRISENALTSCYELRTAKIAPGDVFMAVDERHLLWNGMIGGLSCYGDYNCVEKVTTVVPKK